MRRSIAGRRFAPAPHWTLLAIAAMALFGSLGRWQLHRAEEKRALFEGFAAGTASVTALPAGFTPVARYQRVVAAGRYDGSRQFLLDNMTHEGTPGLRVLTPLVRDDGSVLVVDRGFIAWAGDRRALPDLPVDGDLRRVTGRMDSLPRPAVELAAAQGSGWPRLVSFPHTTDLSAALDAPVHPQVLLLDSGEPDGFLRDWQPPGMTPERHVGYAVQWFGLAAAVFVTWFALSLKPEAREA